jgi:hemoglobin
MTAMRLIGLVLVMTAAACGGNTKKEETTTTTVPEKSLYERLGGKEAITAVVDQFVTNVAADEVINARFKDSDIPHLKLMLVEQVCQATGGPCQYTGKSMAESHAGMQISEEEFNALVGDLVAALDKLNVPEKEKNELLGALAALKGDIVGK